MTNSMSDDILRQMRIAFRQEAADLLAELNESLLALEVHAQDQELINRVFRAMHTIKGSGATAGFMVLSHFAHKVEDVFIQAREGRLIVTPDLVDVALRSSDLFGELLRVEEDAAVAFEPATLELIAELSRFLPARAGAPAVAAATAVTDKIPARPQTFRIFFRPNAAIFYSGSDPVSLLEELRPLGDYQVQADVSQVPMLGQLESEKCYLAWTIHLTTTRTLQDIREVFVFVEEDSELSITAVNDSPAVTPETPVVEAQVSAAAESPVAPEIHAPTASNGRSESAASLRVDQEKLDRLMRVVGELLVARGAFPILANRLNLEHQLPGMAKEVRDAGSDISRIAEELQATVMAIRMLPIKTVFQKFPRLVRDSARAMNKEIDFDMQGQETELDKTVLEQIGDPLVHLVRNAIDHGVETAAQRVAAGKSPTGSILLKAGNQGHNVILEISDDGAGIDPDKLRRSAVKKGLITQVEADAMSDRAAIDLIFAAGFSTAEKITDISGRGVGMDVVRNNIRRLQGTIEIETQVGRGTRFIIKLPTSLMIAKGILIQAAGQEFILPMENIQDMVKLPAESLHLFQGKRIAQTRGQVYSVLSLAELCGQPLTSLPPEVAVAILQSEKKSLALIVDRFVSEVEVVIKPLTAGLANLAIYQGATIMGDGRVVLVLNPAELAKYLALAAA